MISRRSVLLAAFAPAGPEMVPIPGGTFRMGSDKDALLREFPNAGAGMKSLLFEETPSHEVTIAPFLMGRCEVTNAGFQGFVQARPEWRKARVGGDYLRHWNGDTFPDEAAKLPVVFGGMGIRGAWRTGGREISMGQRGAGAGSGELRPIGNSRPGFRSKLRRESVRAIRSGGKCVGILSGGVGTVPARFTASDHGRSAQDACRGSGSARNSRWKFCRKCVQFARHFA